MTTFRKLFQAVRQLFQAVIASKAVRQLFQASLATTNRLAFVLQVRSFNVPINGHYTLTILHHYSIVKAPPKMPCIALVIIGVSVVGSYPYYPASPSSKNDIISLC